MAGMTMGTPAATPQPAMELDQAYIDMMIPHHASIVALAQAALPRLTEPRLQTMAQSIIDAQRSEITELQGYRQQWYGSPEPMSMDEAMMAAMMHMMPSMTGTMEQMAMQMNPEAEVVAFCAGEDANLTFIDLTIPHHQVAIQASEAAVTRAKHPEIQAFAQRVIAAQQREIDELQQVRAKLTGEGTPTDS
jgi:uncharacterized protein (DUF305 family)